MNTWRICAVIVVEAKELDRQIAFERSIAQIFHLDGFDPTDACAECGIVAIGSSHATGTPASCGDNNCVVTSIAFDDVCNIHLISCGDECVITQTAKEVVLSTVVRI